MARTELGLTCSPPPEIRIALLGLRCEASTQGMHLISVAMADAEELVRSAPRGSIPWAQAVNAYNAGMLVAGRIGDLLETIRLLREVDPAPEAMGRMALAFLGGICTLDVIGQVPEGTALEDRFFLVLSQAGDREPLARYWWNFLIGLRAAYAHEDPWSGLMHGDALQAIFDVIGGERVFLAMRLVCGMNLWYLGASALAEQALEGIPAADTAMGPGSSLRRFHLSWLYADRGALDQARALATQLSEYGAAHHNPLEEGRGRWVLAEVLRRMGDLRAAERELKVALTMAVPLERPGVMGTLSALRLAQGRVAEGLATAEVAMSRCTDMGGCGMFRGAFVRLAHAEALHAAGAHDSARHAIAEARAHLFTIAGRIADPDHKKSFLENVPENARILALARAWLGELAPST